MGITIDHALNYYVFIPGETEAQPYSAFISSIDLNENLVYEYTISISQQGEEYYAELLEVITREVIMKWQLNTEEGGSNEQCIIRLIRIW